MDWDDEIAAQEAHQAEETGRQAAMDRLVRAGLVNPDGSPTPFYTPGNTDHTPHILGSWNPDPASGRMTGH